MVALAAVAVVALLAAVAIALTRGDDDPGTAATTSSTSTPSTTAPRSTTSTTVRRTTTTTAAPASADRPDGVPADWEAYTGSGWTLWHPADWTPSASGAGSVDFTNPDGDYLRLGTTSQPSDDPKGAWEAQEKAFAANHPDYHRIRIDDADYRGLPAAIWEFTFQGQHAADLGFVDGDRGFALNLVTDEGSWDASQDIFEAFQAGFQSS
jgi:hypothetical protein